MTGEWLMSLSAVAVCLTIAAVVFLEAAVFLGFFLPAETFVIVGGILASQGVVPVWVLFVVVAGCALGGSIVGFVVGRRAGPRLLRSRLLRSHERQVSWMNRTLEKRARTALVVGQFVTFFRAMMPALAGISTMGFRQFVVFTTFGTSAWAAVTLALGYFAGASLSRFHPALGPLVVAVAVLGALATVVWWTIRRRRRRAVPQLAV
ncbi:hypothetical protein GCM10025865_11290 [Paraoerskovia sediminicola]|uniref:VTT domain-containing protein n=1 Tax=Paraoerskovia sediminicola TaxID=1138587 RepID=A0ABN6XA77_9CELL|nr:DedA family protein [Paraoerskovia sediminicola]BDZ41830.1 hypothetical protein GCM10025865_11290 [Paraoerskovia sediminicola]